MPLIWKKGHVVEDNEMESQVEYRWITGDDPILILDPNRMIDTSANPTFLIAKVNSEWFGQFASGRYDKHAEEDLLESLRRFWMDMLAEDIVWRPTKSRPRNVLSIKITRSPCGVSGHACGKRLIAFLNDMNQNVVSDTNPL